MHDHDEDNTTMDALVSDLAEVLTADQLDILTRGVEGLAEQELARPAGRALREVANRAYVTGLIEGLWAACRRARDRASLAELRDPGQALQVWEVIL